MPLLTSHSSYSCLSFAASEVPQLATGRCQCSGPTVSHSFAKARRLLRARETSTFRFATLRAVKEGTREPVNMTVSTESIAQSDDISALSHIMEPIHEGDRDLLLVYCPGALQASENYFPLMHEIQAQLSLRLWIVVLHNTNQEALSSSKVDASLTGVIARLQERGFRSVSSAIENVFIAGHSIGAWVGRPVALKRAQGFIQMGSSFNAQEDNLPQHPKPVLTLGGGRDGQMTPAAIAKHAGDVLATERDLGRHNTCAVKPVIIIPGMNHAQFSDGRPNLERGDLNPAISITDGRRRAGELAAAFLAVQSEGPSGPAGARGLEILTKGVEETHTRYRVLWESLANQTGDAVAHQLHVASSSALSADNITTIHHDFVDNFVISKPSIDIEMNKVFITTYLKPAVKQGICNLWVKMKSREALALHFDTAYVPAAQIETLGKEINTKTFDTALSLVSDDAREMYLKHGKKLRFMDDWLCPPPATIWIESDLSFTATPSGDVEVRTPVLLSPMNMPPRFAGMHYMKVLTLARAIHWILLDSFR
ncbi:hypothetical protein M758_11G004400 [Ceratodon purpureus]|nr:hypothetical protein M758_11G004400 [Ceratodon purpureus]